MSRRGAWYRHPMPNPISQEQLNDPQWKACHIKIDFESREAAEQAITNAGLSKGGHRRGSSYKCKYCPYWHCSSKRRLKV